MKRLAEAIRDLDEYLLRKPENVGALRDRLWLRMENGDARGVLEDYKRLRATEQSAAEAQRARAWAAAKTGETGETIDALTAALEEAPDDTKMLAWRA